MINFGTSAFIRIVHLNIAPRRREIRKRLEPSDGSGYDFHKRMRRDCRRHLLEGVPAAEILDQADSITRLPERASAKAAFEQLFKWRDSYPDVVYGFDEVRYESPSGLFSVKFEPQFGYSFGALQTAVHIWNTKKPPLNKQLVGAVLSLFPEVYSASSAPDDLAILSLRDRRLYRLSEMENTEKITSAIVTGIENIIEDESSIGPSPSLPPPGPITP